MKSRLIRTLMVAFCLVAGAPATQANTESSLCRIVSLPSLCSQGGASASNVDSTGAGSVEQPRPSSISLDLKPAAQNSGVGLEGIAARIAEEVQSNLRALTNHPVVYTVGTGKWDATFSARVPAGGAARYGSRALSWADPDVFCGTTVWKAFWWGEKNCAIEMAIPRLAQMAYKSILDKARSDFNYYRAFTSNSEDIEIIIDEVETYSSCSKYVYSYVIRPSALRKAVAINRNFPAYSWHIDGGMYNLLRYSISGSTRLIDNCYYSHD